MLRNLNTYGGRIYEYDYDRVITLTEMANRIVSDFYFDQTCKKNIQIRNMKTEKGRTKKK